RETPRDQSRPMLDSTHSRALLQSDALGSVDFSRISASARSSTSSRPSLSAASVGARGRMVGWSGFCATSVEEANKSNNSDRAGDSSPGHETGVSIAVNDGNRIYRGDDV